MTAANGLVRFVGLDAYRAAGGRSFQDLFAQDTTGHGTYIQDRTIIENLALEKLATGAEIVRAEGGAWVDVCLELDHDRLGRWGRIWPEIGREACSERVCQ